jgi:predicted PolB exonuclease-like 3'-5' exonuclease
MITLDNRTGWIILDIETIPNQHITPPVFNAAYVRLGVLKDPAKIVAKIEEEKIAFVSGLTKKMSLDANLCEIVSIGWISVSPSGGIEDTNTLYYSDGDAAICQFFSHLFQKGKTLVTWNGKHFDIPVLWKRSLWNGHAFCSGLDFAELCNPYRNDRHIDLSLIYNAGSQYGALKDCCQFLGIGCKEGMDGSMIFGSFQAGKEKEIREYNLQDCHCNLAVARMLQIIPSPI